MLTWGRSSASVRRTQGSGRRGPFPGPHLSVYSSQTELSRNQVQGGQDAPKETQAPPLGRGILPDPVWKTGPASLGWQAVAPNSY